MKKRIDENSMAALALAAMQEAVDEVIDNHERTGTRLAIWRNGKVAYITAAEARREQKRLRRIPPRRA